MTDHEELREDIHEIREMLLELDRAVRGNGGRRGLTERVSLLERAFLSQGRALWFALTVVVGIASSITTALILQVLVK